jgi:hypothetical protein
VKEINEGKKKNTNEKKWVRGLKVSGAGDWVYGLASLRSSNENRKNKKKKIRQCQNKQKHRL